MNSFDEMYLKFVSHVMWHGAKRESRAGPTRQVFGTMFSTDAMRHEVFPILTSRKIFYKPVLGELAAFLRGATDLQTFKDFGCNYWDANAAAWDANKDLPKEKWDVGNIYGNKWRWFNDIDQLKQLVFNLKHNPLSRRHLLTAYDPAEEYQCLPPCHLMSQYNVDNDGFLDCIVYLRSVDLCLGLPSDIVLYAAFTILLAQQTGYKPGTLTFMLADTHIYENHVAPFKKQLAAPTFDLPTWILEQDVTIDNFIPGDLRLTDYQHGERIEYPFAA